MWVILLSWHTHSQLATTAVRLCNFMFLTAQDEHLLMIARAAMNDMRMINEIIIELVKVS